MSEENKNTALNFNENEGDPIPISITQEGDITVITFRNGAVAEFTPRGITVKYKDIVYNKLYATGFSPGEDGKIRFRDLFGGAPFDSPPQKNNYGRFGGPGRPWGGAPFGYDPYGGPGGPWSGNPFGYDPYGGPRGPWGGNPLLGRGNVDEDFLRDLFDFVDAVIGGGFGRGGNPYGDYARRGDPYGGGLGGTVEGADTFDSDDDGRRFAGHVFFSGRQEGWNKTLTGNVILYTIAVSSPMGQWYREEYQNVMCLIEDRISPRLEREARRNGSFLSIKTVMEHVSVNTMVSGNNLRAIMEAIPRALGYSNIIELHDSTVRRYNCDEVAIIVLPAHYDRSFSILNNTETPEAVPEFATVFTDPRFPGAYIHELLHLYGALDFYLPVFSEAADRYLPGSIMYVGNWSDAIDDLTCYLIGWTKRLSPNAVAFLSATRYVTLRDLHAATASS